MKFHLYLTFVIMLIILIGCNFEIQPLKKFNLNGKSKLYFYNIPSADSREKQFTNDFKLKHKNFYIDDLDVLNQIKEEWVLEKSTDKTPMKSFYRISLLDGNKIIWGGVLDLEGNEIITHPYPLKFDIELIEKYSKNFKRLDGFNINCDNISNARLLFEELINKECFVGIFDNENGKNPLYIYDGTMLLLLPKNKSESDFKKIEESVRKDFKKIQNTEIARFSASFEKDSIEIEVYSKKSISESIPDKYTIVKNFEELKNIEIPVFGITKNYLEKIITKLGLEQNVQTEEI